MIRLADNASKQQVWDMWKICFGDSDEYMELYFRNKYRPENTLLYMEGSKAVASLQMLNYRFTFHGAEVPVIYLSGVCTLPEYRKKGYTRALLLESFNEAIRREVPLILLVPQEKWLMDLYAKFGFAQTFDPGTEALPALKELVNSYPGDLEAAYREFDRRYRKHDMTVQKAFDDFKTIVEEAALFDFPVKKSLPGMARVIDAGRLLSLFVSQQEGSVSFSVSVRDELITQNNLMMSVSGGISEVAKRGVPGEVPDIAFDSVSVRQSGNDMPIEAAKLNVDIRDLAQLLLGYRTASQSEPCCMVFPEKSPQMHFMLE